MTAEPTSDRESGYHPASGTGFLLLALLLAGLEPAWLAIVACGLLLIAFVCAVFENSLQHFSRAQLADDADDEEHLAALDLALLKEDEILFASKLARGLTQMTGVALIAVALAESELASTTAFWLVGLATVLFVIFNLALPYVLGTRRGHVVLLRGLLPYSRVLAPFLPLTIGLQRLVSRMLRAAPPPDPAEEIADELRSVVEEGTREGTIDTTEKEMIEGVMDLKEVDADEIMTPRTEMVCLPIGATVEEAIERSLDRGLSRLPIYRETPDDICGVLYMKDLLPHVGKPDLPTIESLARKPFFIPATKNVSELMQEMRARQTHLAIVLDEYGGTAGIVTFEDILEEIVGEIADEHETSEEADVVRITENAAQVEGRAHIDDLNEALGIDLPESEEYETVGGLLFSRMGRVPTKGEHFDLEMVRFTILEADERRINRVKVTVDR